MPTNNLQAVIRRNMEMWARNTAKSAQSAAPQGKTGNLKRGIRTTPFKSAVGGYEIGVESTAPYSGIVEYGTQKHNYPIPPSKAPRLVFYWEREGRMFIGRPGQAITHPGQEAQPFMIPAAQNNLETFMENLAAEVSQDIMNTLVVSLTIK